jgi:oxalate decarboxylase
MAPESAASFVKNPSRRMFLGTGSAALAAMALGSLSARAQVRTSTEAAERDHSLSDPGQENHPLYAENPDSNTPPSSDHGDVGPIWYSFDLTKKRVEQGGWTHQVTQRELASSKDIAGVNMRLTAGSFRELHWHTADEWAYVLYGNARITVMKPDGTMFINDVSEGDVWLFPAGYPHSIQGLGPDGTEFLLIFNQGMFSEDGTMLLSEFLAHMPTDVLAQNLNVDKSVLSQMPPAPLYIFPSDVPGPLDADRAEIGSPQATTGFTFGLKSMTPTISTDFGSARVIDSTNFPASKYIAAALVTVKPGGMRELHWHPNASEWQFYIAGKGRMSVYMPVDNARTADYHANDVGYVPANAGHYIQNTGDSDLVFLEMFAADKFEDVSLNNWLRRLPAAMVTAHTGFDAATIAKIPAKKQEVL